MLEKFFFWKSESISFCYFFLIPVSKDFFFGLSDEEI